MIEVKALYIKNICHSMFIFTLRYKVVLYSTLFKMVRIVPRV